MGCGAGGGTVGGVTEGHLAEIVDGLRRIVGSEHVLTDAFEREPYEIDWTRRYRGTTPAVIRPGSVDEVAAIVAWCRETGAALVPQGGNTGLVGGSVPMHGEVVLSLGRMRTIDPVDTAARQVTVQAGATIEQVQAAARAAGLRYAVDFGARGSATVGGSIATNAGGLNVLRHGGTREQVVGVEAVLGTGHVVRRLQGLVKDNTGYHWPSILCGSEGTLGIVTAARLRLISLHEHVVTALVAFDDLAAAVDAVATWRSTLDDLEAAELMLDDGVRLVCDVTGMRAPFDRPWPVYVLAEVAAHGDPTDALGAAVEATAGVGDVAVADVARQRADLWRYREEHTPSIGVVCVPRKFDVTLPMSRLAEFLSAVGDRVAAASPGARTVHFGHVGDGNIHVNVLPPAGEQGPVDATVDEVVLRHVVELGGSISAEHGIGAMKAPYLHLDRTADEIAAMRALKSALDPQGVLNPHVMLPPDP